MFEMLVGYPPFYLDDPMTTCRKVLSIGFVLDGTNQLDCTLMLSDSLDNLEMQDLTVYYG
jgi:hypothetical protein